jgi:hypothetical protein
MFAKLRFLDEFMFREAYVKEETGIDMYTIRSQIERLNVI